MKNPERDLCLIAAVVCLGLLVNAHCQDKLPDAPSKVFWTLAAVDAGAVTADLVTSRQMLDRGCYETNPLYGHYPSAGRMTGIMVGITAGELAFAHFAVKSRKKWLYRPAFALVGYEAAQHMRFSYANTALRCYR